MIEKVKRLIISGCYGDVLLYKDYFNTNDEEVIVKNQWSYIVEMLIITIKSLLPSFNEVRNEIDYKRLHEEINIWKYYRHGGNKLLINTENIDESYWNSSDNSVYSRIFPIVISNKNFEYIKDEVIKNILYTTGNIKILLEGIFLSKVIYCLLENVKDYDKIIVEVKNEIINMSIKEIKEKYNENYRLDITTYSGNYILDFERKRIDIINLLNGITKEEYRLLDDILNILKEEITDYENIKPNFLTYSIIGLKRETVDQLKIKDKDFLLSLCDYLVKLRNGRISPELLKLENYFLPDVFKYKENDEFNHSLLNKCRVKLRIENNNFIKLFIETKSGIYRFIKVKHP